MQATHCVTCGREIIDGEGRYITADGAFCLECWLPHPLAGDAEIEVDILTGGIGGYDAEVEVDWASWRRQKSQNKQHK